MRIPSSLFSFHFCSRAWFITLLVLLCTMVSPALRAQNISEQEKLLLRPDDTTSYAPPADARQLRLSEELKTIGEEAGVKIETKTKDGYIHYDETQGIVYSPERTRISYQDMYLEADMLLANMTTLEVEASGNVILNRGEDAELWADKLNYNMKKGSGSAVKARGHFGAFRISHGDESQGASFEQLNKDEFILRNVTVTTCDFSKPHYYLKAREVVFYPGQKVFLRSATLYVRDTPVFYFPFYSKTLGESSPWFTRVGFRSELGAWLRVGYSMKHSTEEPDPLTDKMKMKSNGELRVFGDYMTKRGPGGGLTYEYSLDYDRHRGLIDLYTLSDSDRNVTKTNGGDEDSLERYNIFIKHRSQLTDELVLTANVDYFSDPDLFYEVLDVFNTFERKRVMERRARMALTLARDNWVGRLMIEQKSRIGRDRLSNFSVPADNDRDFDEQPDLLIDKRGDKGISTDRWGDVTQRAPQVEISTAWLKMWQLPVFYHTDLNLFNSLDRGLNAVDTSDDAYVRGFDWYNAVMWRWHLSQRSSLMAQLGVGAGMAGRDEEDMGYDFKATPDEPYLMENEEGGLTFIDPDTFLIGTTPFNYKDDVSDGQVYGDTKLRYHSRLSDSLTFDMTHQYRKTSDDSIGEWYAQMGNRYVREDLYNFRMRRNDLDAVLRYRLANPRLNVDLHAWRNLESESELYPSERVSSYGVRAWWESADKTLSISSNPRINDTQIFHTSDPLSYIDNSFNWNGDVRYSPLHKRWWTRVGMYYTEKLDQEIDTSARDRFTESDNRMILKTLLGAKVGPKWVTEVSSEYNSRTSGFRRISFRFQRDLHDAYLMMILAFRDDIYSNDSQDKSFGDNIDIRLALQPKMPDASEMPSIPGMTVINSGGKQPALSDSNVN